MSEVQDTKRYMYLSVPKGIKVQVGTAPIRVYLLYLTPQRARPPPPLQAGVGGTSEAGGP